MARPWVGKKIKEYMNVEDLNVVNMVIKVLNQRPTVQQLRDKLKGILDVKTEEFVVKVWQTMLFEQMKIEEGLYATQ